MESLTVYVIAFISLIHVGYCQENVNFPPLLNVSKPYINVPPNNSLTIECRGEKEVAWRSTSSKDFTGTTLHLSPFYNYTGLYTCFYDNFGKVELQRNASVYVFMNDPKHLFVPQTKYNTTLNLEQNSKSHLYIPCLPTNSEIIVTLWEFRNSSEGVKHVPTSDMIKFDPTKGFLVLQPLSGNYFCRGYWNNLEETTSIFNVKDPSDQFTKLFIEGSSLEWSVGEKSYLNCSVAVKRNNVSHSLKWTYPQSDKKTENNNVKQGWLQSENGKTYDFLFSTLNIAKVEMSHEGFYSCSLMEDEGNNTIEKSKEHIYISVNDGNMTVPIKFETEMNTSSPIIGETGKSITFSVNVTNYRPEDIEIHWEKDGLVIQDTDKYKLNTQSMPITLSIDNLELSDVGKYTLTGRRIYPSTTNNISLNLAIKGTPFVQIIPPVPGDRFYKYGSNYSLQCYVRSYPQSDISWFWNKCSDWDICDSRILIPNIPKSTKQLENLLFQTTSVLTVNERNESGIFDCIANNSIGRNETSVDFILTDISGGKPVLLTKGGNSSVIKVTCQITSMVYEKINWFFIQVPSHYDMVNVNNLTGFQRQEKKQNYSETSILSFSVHNDRSGLYACSFTDKRNKKVVDRFIAVHLNVASTTSPASTIPPVGSETLTPTTVTIISVVVVAALLIIVTTTVVVVAARKRKIRYDPYSFRTGQVDLINPNLPLEDQVELLPYDPKWEFPRDRLKLGRVIGHGAFGRVVKADAIGLEANASSTVIAVKMLKDKNDNVQYKSLMAELKIMIHLGRHVNIVNLKGAVTKNLHKGELMVMVEYCCHGNLRSYLLRNREKFINQIDPVTGAINRDITCEEITEPARESKQGYYYSKPIALGISNPSYDQSSTGQLISSSVSYMESTGDSSTIDPNLSGRDTSTGTVMGSESGYSSTGEAMNVPFNSKDTARYSGYLTTSDLLCYCFQCAQGMSYLSSRKLLHRDLAARNILLAEGNVIKISDFGLARDIYKYSQYVKKADDPLPIKWMAIESIRDKVFTIKSDVWSFGILMWEIFTLGGSPYPGSKMNEEFFRRLQQGYRMEKPEYSPDEIYKVMLDCWEKNPKDRPEFSDLSEKLGSLLEDSVKEYYLDLNAPYASLNTDLRDLEDYLKMNTSNYLQMNPSIQETNVDNGPAYITAGNINFVPEQPKHTYCNIPPLIKEYSSNEHCSGLESDVAPCGDLQALTGHAKSENEVKTKDGVGNENLSLHSNSSQSAEEEGKQNR